MRVALVTEVFLPQLNGVTHSVMRVAEYLRDNGHEAIIIAPGDPNMPATYAGFPIHSLPSVNLPIYRDFRMGFTPGFVLNRLFTDFAPDVVHVAAPFVIGATALDVTAKLSIPSVALYQTDIPSFASRYGFSLVESIAWARMRDIHSTANLTLAPSTYSRDQLISHGVSRVKIWGRGVDTVRFSPTKRSDSLHQEWAPNNEIVIGYMGRLAAEKQVSDLTVLRDIPGTVLVIIGDGPTHKALTSQLPDALFLGSLAGDDLARAVASIDVFVHPGELETFCQAIQEALASGLPVVAPRKGGPIDLIRQGVTGFLYPPGHLEEMRKYVVELVTDEAKRESFSQSAREFTTDRTWQKICDQLVEHYMDAIDMVKGKRADTP